MSAGSWNEGTVTYASRPAIDGPVLGSIGRVDSEADWYEVDVTAAVRGNGVVAFGLRSSDADGVGYSSRESGDRPQLVVTVLAPTPTAAATATAKTTAAATATAMTASNTAAKTTAVATATAKTTDAAKATATAKTDANDPATAKSTATAAATATAKTTETAKSTATAVATVSATATTAATATGTALVPTPTAVATTAATATAVPSDAPGAAIVPGGLKLTATFNSVGVELPFSGDSNANAAAALQFRTGAGEWRDALAARPVEREPPRGSQGQRTGGGGHTHGPGHDDSTGTSEQPTAGEIVHSARR
jgi:hypothetical protein